MLVLFIIGILGAAGLFFVLNSSSDKSGFSSKEEPVKMELSQQLNQTDEAATAVVF